jgi:exonuclease VII small subunit
LAREQGLKGIVEKDVNYLALPEEFPGPRFFETIRTAPKESLQTGLVKVRSRVSHERAVEEFVAFIRQIQPGGAALNSSTSIYEWTRRAPSNKRLADKEDTKAIARLIKERDALRTERDAILGSTSWKMSAPVRLASIALRKVANGIRK